MADDEATCLPYLGACMLTNDCLAESAIYDVDIINLASDAAGSFFLLAASAATTKYLWLKNSPGSTAKKAV